MQAGESTERLGEQAPGLGAEPLAGLIRQASSVQTTRSGAGPLLTLELCTTALQLFICFRGKAYVLSWERITEGPSLLGSRPRVRIRGGLE